MSDYNKDLDKVLFQKGTKGVNRWLNVEVYSYNGGAKKARIKPRGENKNATDPSKKWINHKAISGLTAEEISGLIGVLKEALAEVKK